METCKHCGRDLRDAGTPHMNGIRVHWVHDPGGYAICSPQLPASTVAEPVDGRPSGFYAWEN